MADMAITDYTEKTDVTGEELIEVVDLRESDTADQNKKMALDTIFSSIMVHHGEVITHNGEVVYT